MKTRRLKIFCASIVVLIVLGFLLSQNPIIPIQGATSNDWNKKSFWFEPWGVSGVHKGIDIFSQRGTPVVSSTSGLVVYSGHLGIGGTVVAVLCPDWRIYYYAHLDQSKIGYLSFAAQGSVIGTVGTSGNAAGKPPHLHFSIISIVPIPWKFTTQTQGWKRMFFLDPDSLLRQN
jgi:peptidoglycan LD-endopeptidase LytH